MSVASAFKIGEAIAVFFNPDRRERATYKGAIEAGDELMMIKDAMIARGAGAFSGSRTDLGRYAKFTDKQLREYEVHFSKQWKAWKDGQS